MESIHAALAMLNHLCSGDDGDGDDGGDADDESPL